MRCRSVVALALLLTATTASALKPGRIVLATPGASSLRVTFNDGNDMRFTATSTGIEDISSAIDAISGCGLSSGDMVCSMSGEAGGAAIADLSFDFAAVVKTIDFNPGASIPSGEEWTHCTTDAAQQASFVSDPAESEDIVADLFSLGIGGGTTITRKTALYTAGGEFVTCDSSALDCEDVEVTPEWGIGDWIDWYIRSSLWW